MSAAAAATAEAAPSYREEFPAKRMRSLFDPTGRTARLLDDPRRIFGLLRWLAPILVLRRRNLAVVTRYDDVQDVLSRDADFPVYFDQRFRELDPSGTNFILGMADTDEYRAVHAVLMRTFALADLGRVGAIAQESANAALDAAGGRIDGIAELVTRTPMDIVRRYYGVPIEAPDFPLWNIGMSGYSFAPPSKAAAFRQAGIAGAERVTPILEAAIRAAKATPDAATIVGRLVLAQRENPGLLTDDVLRASLSGMITGFVPTNTMAGGHILEMLLRRPDMLAAAEAAARAGDDDLLGRCLFEALRFKPINLGPFRVAAADIVLAEGTRRAKRIPKGTVVLACTHSASFDPRRVANPDRFDPSRGHADTMRFGFGRHWCIGFALAGAQITQTFKPLLLRGNLRRVPGSAGRMRYFGVFPEHLSVTYGPAGRA